MKKHTSTFDTQPVVGERVTGYGKGPGYRSTFSGVYVGIKPSEWDGEMMHMFTDGDINGIKQANFGFPVANTVSKEA